MNTIQEIQYIRDRNGRKLPLEILYADERLLAISKPSGIPVIPDRWQPELPNIRDILQQRLDRQIWIVHRLDADTSGIMLFALEPEMHRYLSQQFEHSLVEKTYLALVKGHPAPDAGTIDLPLLLKTNQRAKMVVSKKGKPSQTHYKLLETFERFSLVEAKPVTGRTHQIRVHLAELGFPLAIDPIYSSADPILLSQIKIRYTVSTRKAELPLIARLTLHAQRIEFTDESGQQRTFSAELPKDFRNLLNALQKWNRK
ncbi:MAG: RluA family pseudouridine synthase [Calditrichia bacterium]